MDNGAPRNGGPAYNVPALEKSIDIIELLASTPLGLGMTEMAQQLGRSVSEIYRIVVVLERRGIVVKDASLDKYSLSLRLFELAHRHPPTKRITIVAQPILDDLARRTDQSCHLSVSDGDDLLILATAESLMPMHYSVRIGARFPLLETSSGHILLAYSDAAAVGRHLARLSPVEQEETRTRLRRASISGYERWASRVVAGVVNLACPVFDHGGTVLAAMTVPYLAQTYARMTVEDTLLTLRESAMRMSERLGFKSA
ncbi:MAG: IclR family transcriptional regulator [Alphaproteobacteria bacterium]